MTSSQKAVKIVAICLAVFIILMIVSAVLSIINSLVYGGEVLINDSKTELEYTETYKNIRNLEIDLESTNLEIYTGSEFKVDTYDTKDTLKVEVVGETLKVKERSRFFWNSSMGGTVVIYVPEDANLNEVELDIGAGKVTLDDLQASKLSLDQGAGTVEIKSSSFSKVEIDGGAGKITISDSTLENLDLDAGVGSVEIEGKILGNSEIDVGVGSMKLRIDGSKEDYSLKIDKGIGSVKVDGVETTGSIGNGPNYIKIEGGVGSIAIDFN